MFPEYVQTQTSLIKPGTGAATVLCVLLTSTACNFISTEWETELIWSAAARGHNKTKMDAEIQWCFHNTLNERKMAVFWNRICQFNSSTGGVVVTLTGWEDAVSVSSMDMWCMWVLRPPFVTYHVQSFPYSTFPYSVDLLWYSDRTAVLTVFTSLFNFTFSLMSWSAVFCLWEFF